MFKQRLTKRLLSNHLHSGPKKVTQQLWTKVFCATIHSNLLIRFPKKVNKSINSIFDLEKPTKFVSQRSEDFSEIHKVSVKTFRSKLCSFLARGT